MSACKFGVVVFPGSNCDRDVVAVTSGLLKCPTRLIWHTETDLQDINVLILPGGFSYGDYLRCGAIARFAPVMSAVKQFAEQGGWVLGICNGFQILIEAGLLPGALVRNQQLKFICDHVPLRVERTDLIWTRGYALGQSITLPIAHGEGCYTCDADMLGQLQQLQQIVFRYQGSSPNGSVDQIAGICNRTGNILGLMPHPERASDPQLNPLSRLGTTDGLPLWQSILQSVSHTPQMSSTARSSLVP